MLLQKYRLENYRLLTQLDNTLNK